MSEDQAPLTPPPEVHVRRLRPILVAALALGGMAFAVMVGTGA